MQRAEKGRSQVDEAMRETFFESFEPILRMLPEPPLLSKMTKSDHTHCFPDNQGNSWAVAVLEDRIDPKAPGKLIKVKVVTDVGTEQIETYGIHTDGGLRTITGFSVETTDMKLPPFFLPPIDLATAIAKAKGAQAMTPSRRHELLAKTTNFLRGFFRIRR